MDEVQLREVLGEPAELVRNKIADRLNPLTRQFVERSPFVVVATGRPDGGLDVPPRGDPDRIAILFFIPGVNDTFRVNGRARIVDDPELLAPSAVEGKAPQLGILVEVEEAYTQCPKALLRSQLWNPERHVDRSELPSSGEILRWVADPELDVEEYEDARADRYKRREGFY